MEYHKLQHFQEQFDQRFLSDRMKLLVIAVVSILAVAKPNASETCPDDVKIAAADVFEACRPPGGPGEHPGPRGPPQDRRKRQESNENAGKQNKKGPKCVEEKIDEDPVLSEFFQECEADKGNKVDCHVKVLQENCGDVIDEIFPNGIPPMFRRGPPPNV